ncbi:PIG-L deacetylase family protein [Winogradskya humida]|uniref:PIG-L domain-containing protein n=1 Tax=Winogradskya humida TaxID=113566 RepID=A0ABQ4A5T8_9ACTN|nr:PIG-L deacetylase family protein [Actinoplanes humidus]GIE26222.1 PIG-L domain-containing protein [Actinoplanes humidus]
MTGFSQAVRAVGRPVHASTSSWWRRALRHRAVDATALVTGRRIMVLAPHPDDETLGCGAVIARARAAGDQVTVVIATDGRHSSRSQVLAPEPLARVRSGELRTACRALGVAEQDVVQLGREDGTLSDCLPEVAAELAALLADRRPDTVFVTCRQDSHPDHEALHEALSLALRYPVPAQEPPQVLAYPIWAWTSGPWFLAAGRLRTRRLTWALRQLFTTGWVEIPAGDHLAAKRSAIEAYASQTTNFTGEASWSYLPADAVSLFLQPSEIFLAVGRPEPVR